jgi:hypothetical protein
MSGDNIRGERQDLVCIGLVSHGRNSSYGGDLGDYTVLKTIHQHFIGISSRIIKIRRNNVSD